VVDKPKNRIHQSVDVLPGPFSYSPDAAGNNTAPALKFVTETRVVLLGGGPSDIRPILFDIDSGTFTQTDYDMELKAERFLSKGDEIFDVVSMKPHSLVPNEQAWREAHSLVEGEVP
jgi:hypothetical protein